MRLRHYAKLVSVAVLLSSGIVTLAAQSVLPGRNPSPQMQRRQLELAMQLFTKQSMKPKVTCGMTVIPADPKVDQQAVKPVPDQGTRATIRKVPPAVCR